MKIGWNGEVKKRILMILVTTLPLMQFAATWYVDGAKGLDGNPGSSSLPKATIQAAIDAASRDDVIMVLPGTYASIDASAKKVTIQSTDGAKVTAIDGGGVSQCAKLGVTEMKSTIVGFTLQRGYLNENGAAASRGYVENCVITNNEGWAIVAACAMRNCLVYGNRDSQYAVLMHGEAWNSTIVARSGGRTGWDSHFKNCILVGSIYPSGAYSAYASCENCRTDGSLVGPGNITGDPKFRNALNGDYRLCKDSPCINAGSNAYAAGNSDLIGNTRIIDGIVDMGCYEYGIATPVISPESGTIVSNATLTVKIACGTNDAIIHYTTNGVTPTMESPIYKKFKIHGKTMVKAIAFNEEGESSDMAVAEYAKGRCERPTVTPSDGTVFEYSGQLVSLSHDNVEGILRYTIDGSDPTSESPEYVEPFAIDETTEVRAKVFGETYFDSGVVTAMLTRVWLKVDTPVIMAQTAFTGSQQRVSLTCGTEGAVVRYTTNGQDPNSHSAKYDRPFYVADTSTVKAYATKADYTKSDIAMFEIVKAWNIGDTMGKPDHKFETGGENGFVRVEDSTAKLGESMKSGSIGDDGRSILATTLTGPGTLTFKWKASCEEDEEYEWDHAEFSVDGVPKGWINGETEWIDVSIRIEGAGEHTVTWAYVKDDVECAGQDCVWVSEYKWASDYTATQTTDVPVPYGWLQANSRDVVDEYENYEKVAKQTAYNPRFTVEECYVTGLDPESVNNEFSAAVVMQNGVPFVTWSPDLKDERVYRIWGRESLDSDSEWEYPTNSLHRFFKVSVAMP